jgi:AcrR family transcriptional regulator
VPSKKTATPGQSSTGSPSTKKRRSPISREEGEKRLINAAAELIKHSPFSEVGVREIAELANVNHGFVHTWFGSKNDLLLAVLKEKFSVMAQGVVNAPPGTPAINFFDPDVRLTVRLVLWLDLEGVKTTGLFENMPVIEALTTRYIEVEKIDPSIAREAAIQAISIGLGAGMFGPLLGTDSTETIVPVMKLWRHIVDLLSKNPLQ